jgi:CBS domain-containing protein
MAESIREVMTPDPRTVGPLDTVADAARAMAQDPDSTLADVTSELPDN